MNAMQYPPPSWLPKDHPLWDPLNLILASWAGAPVAPTLEISAKAARDYEIRRLSARFDARSPHQQVGTLQHQVAQSGWIVRWQRVDELRHHSGHLG
jgi:hypothetical protein